MNWLCAAFYQMTMPKTYLNWSSGKDAMMALHKLKRSKESSVDKLVTTINAEAMRVSMHGVHLDLLHLQAKQLGLPLEIIELPSSASMEVYNQVMKECVERLKTEGFTHSAFGDILLEDLKTYREEQLQAVGLKGIFPLWQRDTAELVREGIALGYKAIVVCVNAEVLDRSFCGRVIDEQFLHDLPEGVDPCGENGEFHTFVFDGPLFQNPVDFTVGETIRRDYSPSQTDKDDCFTDTRDWSTKFWFTDLQPKV